MRFFWKKKSVSIPAHIAASLRKSSCSFCLDHIAASICWSYMFGHSDHRWYNTGHSFCQSCILDCSSLCNAGSILSLSCIFAGSYHDGIPGTRLSWLVLSSSSHRFPAAFCNYIQREQSLFIAWEGLEGFGGSRGFQREQSGYQLTPTECKNFG